MRMQTNVRRRKRGEAMTVVMQICFDKESTQNGTDMP
jgi:hypothetical protein